MARPATASYRIAAHLFLRSLGAIYAIAFASLGVQVAGLAGRNGILPAQALLDALLTRMGSERYWQLPTLFWWTGAGDGVLRGACWAGAVAGLAVAAGLAPRLGLVLCWVLYLSLASVVRTFLNFQWDILLLETGFLALALTPRSWWAPLRSAHAPPRWTIFLVQFLLFRLMFSSGVVKLASGDAAWRALRALDVHYFTQPIPTWTAWYAHQLPAMLQTASCAVMFFIELVVPWFVFGPRRLRLAACAFLLALQLLITATGNYAFFNLLAMALCLVLIDDAAWPGAIRRLEDPAAPPGEPASLAPARTQARRLAALLLVTIVVILSTMQMTARWRLDLYWPPAIVRAENLLQPFRILNAYGLFAAMTTTREEIVVEGSDDGVTWLAYEFPYKPGEVTRRPVFVAPHQPRLDWQMWFAALSDYRRQIWFESFLARILQGQPEVLALMERNPFPDRPPRYVRALKYDYRFTDRATRAATGAWWTRTPAGEYAAPLALRP